MLATALFVLLAAAEPAPAPSAPTAERAAEMGFTKELIEKLSAEQLLQAIEEKEHARVKIATRDDSELVPILVPGFFFATILLGIFAALYFRARTSRELHATLRQMIERGVSIPPELITPPHKRSSDLRRGMILIGAGVGIAIFLLATEGLASGKWTMGLVPLLVGAGYVIAFVVERKMKETSQELPG